ncbi:MAG: GtrA family protein [Clostridia bacterium]|nr:GtrA family protein [Clostridia bacterium]
MKTIKALALKYREIIVYIIFGVLTTLVNWAVYTVMVELLKIDITLSNACAWVAGVLFAFITNKIYVFRSKSKRTVTVLRELVSFVGARALTGLMEIFLPRFLIDHGLSQTIFGIDGAAAKALVSVAVVILNYVFSKLIVFKKKKAEESTKESE